MESPLLSLVKSRLDRNFDDFVLSASTAARFLCEVALESDPSAVKLFVEDELYLDVGVRFVSALGSSFVDPYLLIVLVDGEEPVDVEFFLLK